MSDDITKNNRHSIRLKEYDYGSPGLYFITICTHQKKCLLGQINNGMMILSPIGKIAQEFWADIPNHFKHVELDEFVIMPNHVHGIIIINDNNDGKDNRRVVRSNDPTIINNDVNPQNYFSEISPKSGTLGVIVRSYKSSVTRWCRKNKFEYFQWQRNYYEHIIRNDQELYQIRKYIRNNLLKWQLDSENPVNK